MSPIYEQVDKSGLYKHVGDVVSKRFVKAVRPAPLRPLAQLQTQAYTPKTTPDGLRYVPKALTGAQWRAMARRYLEGLRPSQDTVEAPDDNPYWPGVPLAPETTARVVAEQRRRGLRK
jgi:hypothetical protein